MPDDEFSAYAPPAPAPSAPDPYQSRMTAALDKQQSMIDRAEASMGREEQITEDKTRELAPLRQRQLDMALQPMPRPPQMQQAPKAPQAEHHEEEWIMAASLLGALAGGLTRRHMTNALGAFQGFMEGANEGNRQKFDQDFKRWEAENKRIQEVNQNALAQYRQILENRQLDQNQMSVALQVAAAQFDDKAMATAAKTKNSLVIAQLYDKQAEALGRMQTSSEKMALTREEGMRKERMELLKQQMRAAGFGTSPEQMMATVDKIGNYGAPPITGRAGNLIMNEVYAKYPNYDQKEWQERKYRQLIGPRVEAAAETTEARTAATRGVNLDMILRTTRVLLPQAAEASSAIPRTSFVPLNSLMQMADSAIGDPALRRFKMLNLMVAEGYARSMNPQGMMRVDDRRLALEMLGTAESPEAYREALKVLDEAMVRELKVTKDVRQHAPIEEQSIPGGAHGTTLRESVNPIARRAEDVAGQMGLPKGAGLPAGSRPAGSPMPPLPPSGPNMPIPQLPPGWSVREVP
jgi:hypothetical protein